MRKIVVLLASTALAVLVVCGVAWADTFTVTNTNDAGPGSLRAAISRANATFGKDVISFAPNVGGTIGLKSTLPELRGNLEVRGPGAGDLMVRRAAAESFRVFTIADRANVVISGLRISNGYATDGIANCCGDADYGGGVLNEGDLTLRGVTVSLNRSANYGAGIYNVGTLTVEDSTISGNEGQGIYSLNDYFDTLRVEDSTFSENDGRGIYNLGKGEAFVKDSTFSRNRSGGLFNLGTMTVEGSTFFKNTFGGINHQYPGVLTVRNSTFSGNTTFNHGGGIDSNGKMTIESSTFTNNEATGSGGGIIGKGGGIFFSSSDYKAFLRMNIVAGNEAQEGPDVYTNPVENTSFTSRGYNLIGDPSGASGFGGTDLTNTEAGLDPEGLRNNGGPTRTIELMIESPAIDALGAGGCPPPAADQRGVSRPQDGDGNGTARCDIGAFERQAP